MSQLSVLNFPKHPWERIATDLFELNKQTYILFVDYYSRYPEVIKLNSITSTSVKMLRSQCFPGMAFLIQSPVTMDLSITQWK